MAEPRVKKVKKRGILFAPISFLLIVLALVFGISVFFRVSTITVTGNRQYSQEEVIEASGIQTGDNLFFINRGAAYSRIYTRLPYVENAVITRFLPNRLNIRVTESSAIAVVESDSGPWIVDRTCKLLAPADSTDLSALISVDGLTAIAPEVGQLVAPGEAETPKVAYLSVILREISELDLKDAITRIDLSNVANPSFDYLGRFTVKLGTGENVEYKFQCLLSAVEALEPGDRGTLDLSIDRQAHLTYD